MSVLRSEKVILEPPEQRDDMAGESEGGDNGSCDSAQPSPGPSVDGVTRVG